MALTPRHGRPRRRLGAVLLAGVLALALPALPQTAIDAGAPARPTSEALEAPFVDSSHAMQAFRLVDGWLQEGAISGKRGEPIRASRVLGVKVTLRMQGYLLGTGEKWRGDLDAVLQPGAAVGAIDLVPLLEPAAFQAFEEARQRLRDAKRDAVLMARLNPELAGEGAAATLQEIRDQVTIDVQIMHSPVPLVIGADEPDDTMLTRFAPGYHGLLAHRPDAPPDDNRPVPGYAAIWPASALAHNLGPQRQQRVLATALGLPFTAANDLGRPGGPRLFRTEALHVVRPRINLPPAVMARGDNARARNNPDTEQLSRMADRLAQYLVLQFIGQGAVRGTYHPSTDNYGPELAPMPDVALAAFALSQHAATDIRLDRFDAQAGQIGKRVDELLDLVVTELDALNDPLILEPDTAALLALARLERSSGEADPISRRLIAAVSPHVDHQGRLLGLPTEGAAQPREVAPPAAAIAALALGRQAIADRNDDTLTLAAAAAQRLWEREPLGDGNALPWVAMLVESVEPALVAAGKLAPAALADHRARLDEAATALEAFQVMELPAVGPDDVRGGFAIPEPPPGSPPNPTWSTAPLLSFLATTLRLDGLPQPDAFGRLVTARYAARFVERLIFNSEAAFYVRAPSLVVGGVRLALYDNRLSVVPSAMSLIAIDQFRLTVHLMQQELGEAEATQPDAAESPSDPPTDMQPAPVDGEPISPVTVPPASP